MNALPQILSPLKKRLIKIIFFPEVPITGMKNFFHASANNKE
jgi:hypothetical protein